KLNIKLNSTSLFDHSTVNMLLSHILLTQRPAPAKLPGVVPQARAIASPAPAAPELQAMTSPVAEPSALPPPKSAPVAAPVGTVAQPQPQPRPAVAIVGMSGRFPQSQSLEELWRHLAAGDEL